MRIALVRGPYLRPNGVYAWEHLDQTTKHDVVAFESAPSRFNTQELDLPVRRLTWLDGRHEILGYDRFFRRALSRFGLPSDYLAGIKQIVDDFDVVHTSENFNAFSLQAAIATRGTDTIFTFSAGENIPYPLRQRSPLMWRAKSYVNNRAEAMTTTTQLGKRALIHEGVPHKKVKIIPNCIRGERFKPLTNVDPQKIGLPKELADTTNILFVHGLTEQKGTPYLLEAFQQLYSQDVNLILIGENDLSTGLTQAIESDENIIWKRSLPYRDMPLLYNICDIFALPSVTMTNNEEQFGMAAIEAMACGLPTIVTNVGGLPFIVDEGRTSLVVPERSSEKLREALTLLLENETLRTEMGEAGREHVLNSFHPKVVAEDLAQFYDQIKL